MQNEKEIMKYDPKKAKQKILRTVGFPNRGESLLRELSENIIPKCIGPKGDEQDNALKKFTETSLMYLRTIENESHVNLMESFIDRYQTLSRELSETMVKEFDCVNEAEKSLVTLMVNAFIRSIDNSRRLNNLLEMNSTTPNINNYFAVLSKQIDRANRQYINALLTLKQLKAPQVQMNIKTNNAFISNNQQLNLNRNENIKA